MGKAKETKLKVEVEYVQAPDSQERMQRVVRILLAQFNRENPVLPPKKDAGKGANHDE